MKHSDIRQESWSLCSLHSLLGNVCNFLSPKVDLLAAGLTCGHDDKSSCLSRTGRFEMADNQSKPTVDALVTVHLASASINRTALTGTLLPSISRRIDCCLRPAEERENHLATPSRFRGEAPHACGPHAAWTNSDFPPSPHLLHFSHRFSACTSFNFFLFLLSHSSQ